MSIPTPIACETHILCDQLERAARTDRLMLPFTALAIASKLRELCSRMAKVERFHGEVVAEVERQELTQDEVRCADFMAMHHRAWATRA